MGFDRPVIATESVNPAGVLPALAGPTPAASATMQANTNTPRSVNGLRPPSPRVQCVVVLPPRHVASTDLAREGVPPILRSPSRSTRRPPHNRHPAWADRGIGHRRSRHVRLPGGRYQPAGGCADDCERGHAELRDLLAGDQLGRLTSGGVSQHLAVRTGLGSSAGVLRRGAYRRLGGSRTTGIPECADDRTPSGLAPPRTRRAVVADFAGRALDGGGAGDPGGGGRAFGGPVARALRSRRAADDGT